MSNRSAEIFQDRVTLRDAAAGMSPRFFDRFVFNAHRRDAVSPSILVGLGVRPAHDAVDGFAILTTAHEQRNVRFADVWTRSEDGRCGPFSYAVVEPNRTWEIALGDNPTGLAFDLRWEARAPAWWGDIDVTNSSGETTSFAHLFQSGHVSGTLSIDGRMENVDRWYSQRDRSRGVRTMAGGQGLHVWYQAQFDDRSVGFLLVESRAGDRILLEGAVMHVDGRLDPVVDVRHALRFDGGLDLREGRVEVTTTSGARYLIDADACAGGGFMAGGGYGDHGSGAGRAHLESDVYRLDGAVSPRSLSSSLTDRLCSFEWEGRRGTGIFEFALTRSPSYGYTPTLV